MQNGKSDEDSRKLFLGGLPAEAEKKDLEEYFGTFGEIEMVTIKTDVFTGRSRGFGFLIFKDVSSVNQVLQLPGQHQILDKVVEAKLATPQQKGDGEKEKSTKVFVGGLDKNTPKETISDEFSTRGKVVEVYLPIDKMTQQAKGFAFVTFEDSALASSLCAEGKIMIDGKECDIKPAKDKSESRGARGGFHGGRGSFQGRGGGRGGFGGGYGYDSGYGGYEGYGQGGGYGNNYSAGGYGGGYSGNNYDQYSGGYDQSGYGNYGGYDQSGGYSYGGQDQYKMKGNRGGRGGYTPY